MRCAILALLLASGMAATGEISVDVTAEYEEFLATTGLQDVEDTETNPLDRWTQAAVQTTQHGKLNTPRWRYSFILF